MIDITNEIMTKLKKDLAPIRVQSPYSNSKPVFPLVTLKEMNNLTYQPTVDNSGEQHSTISFEINIFDNGNKKESTVKEIRNKIDNIMSTFYKMNRNDSRCVENYADDSIYRWVLRYSSVVSNDETIYRG